MQQRFKFILSKLAPFLIRFVLRRNAAKKLRQLFKYSSTCLVPPPLPPYRHRTKHETERIVQIGADVQVICRLCLIFLPELQKRKTRKTEGISIPAEVLAKKSENEHYWIRTNSWCVWSEQGESGFCLETQKEKQKQHRRRHSLFIQLCYNTDLAQRKLCMYISTEFPE